jgi:myo-inositol-1(or 4)-monophosphatase
LQSAASDLALIGQAARDAGKLARDLLAKPLEIKSKGEAGPVTNIDYAVNDFLAERLQTARPDYGWLSEETPDAPENRIGKQRLFILDPIDGTAAMIARAPQFTISIGVADGGRAFAGAIYNPMTDELFLGGAQTPATFNGRPMRVSTRAKIEGMRMVGVEARFAKKRWPEPWPKMEIIERQSIAYRMALVASDMADATILFGAKHDWDIAGGAAIVEAAGGLVTDPWGDAISFNNAEPRAPYGLIASGPALHPLLLERMRQLPDPRKVEAQ